MKLVRETLITNVEAKEIVSKMGKPDDMKYEQKNTYDNLKKFVVVDPKKIKSLVEELSKNKKIRTRQVISIANTLPEDEDDLRAILNKEYSSFDSNEISQILQTVRSAKTPKAVKSDKSN